MSIEVHAPAGFDARLEEAVPLVDELARIMAEAGIAPDSSITTLALLVHAAGQAKVFGNADRESFAGIALLVYDATGAELFESEGDA